MSWEKWLIPGLVKEMDKMGHLVIPESKEANKIYGAHVERIQNQLEEAPTGRGWDNFRIKEP